MFINSLLSDLASITWIEDCWAHILGWKSSNQFPDHNGNILGYNKSSAKCVGIMLSQKVLLRLSMPGYVFMSDMDQLQVLYFMLVLYRICEMCTDICLFICYAWLCLLSSCCQHMQQQVASTAQKPKWRMAQELAPPFSFVKFIDHTVPGFAGTHI